MSHSLRSLAGATWPALPHESSAQVWTAYRHLDRTQWLPASAIAEGQLEQLRGLLAHAIVHVPYFRQLLAEHGVVPGRIRSFEDFRGIPLSDRRTIQEQPSLFAARTLPLGAAATGRLALGVPGAVGDLLCRTNLSDIWACAVFLRDLEWSSIDPAGVVAVIRPTFTQGDELQKHLAGIVTPCLFPPVAELLPMGPCHVMDMSQEPERQIDWLRSIGAQFLITYPANLDRLTSLGAALPSLLGIQAIGGSLDAASQARHEAAFGVPVRSNYSCREAGLLASACPSGKGWHVHAEAVVLEILDRAGKPCASGQPGRVCITTLHNFQTPLVRFVLADKALGGKAIVGAGVACRGWTV